MIRRLQKRYALSEQGAKDYFIIIDGIMVGFFVFANIPWG